MDPMKNTQSLLNVSIIETFKSGELQELCQSTEEAILSGIGFSWINPPPRRQLENYWKGVLVVPFRCLLIGTLDGVVAGSLQLVFPVRSNEASSFSANIDTHFVAPWARGFGLAKAMIDVAEIRALELSSNFIQLDVRETQEAAIRLFEAKGYKKWGTNPYYAFINGKNLKGHYFFKKLK